MHRVIRSVRLRNFKSIAECDVRMDGLTVLVGSNASGKSNFLDALRFVSEALSQSLDLAFSDRAGIENVRQRSGGHPNHFGIQIQLDLGEGRNGFYAFEIGAQPEGAFIVKRERASVSSIDGRESFFDVSQGEIKDSSSDFTIRPALESDRLLLPAVSALSSFRPLYDALSSIRIYNLNPAVIREPQLHDKGEILKRDGSNLASVISRLERHAPATLDRIQDYLRQIVPGIQAVRYKSLGARSALELSQIVEKSKQPWWFEAVAMSDGTLRSLAVLTALFQGTPDDGRPSFIGIEEPESTIHPGAAAVLMDAMIEASGRNQVVVTTHSPDLLDHSGFPPESLRAVSRAEGVTIINHVEPAMTDRIKRDLATAGELLRQKQLQPELKDRTPVRSADLFRP